MLDIFNPTAIDASDRVAIEATDAILTYGELADAARGFAGRLRLTRVLPSLTAGTHEDRGRRKASGVSGWAQAVGIKIGWAGLL